MRMRPSVTGHVHRALCNCKLKPHNLNTLHAETSQPPPTTSSAHTYTPAPPSHSDLWMAAAPAHLCVWLGVGDGLICFPNRMMTAPFAESACRGCTSGNTQHGNNEARASGQETSLALLTLSHGSETRTGMSKRAPHRIPSTPASSWPTHPPREAVVDVVALAHVGLRPYHFRCVAHRDA